MLRFYYLIYSLFFLAGLLIILRKRPDLRAHVKASLVFGAIVGPLSELLYFRDYWLPYTTVGHGRISPEDVLFGASFCGLAFAAYAVMVRKSPSAAHVTKRIRNRRIVAYLAVGTLLVFAGKLVFGINSVISSAIAFTILAGLIGVRRRDLLLPGLATGATLCVTASLLYAVGIRIADSTILEKIWLLHGTPAGVTILGTVPLTELLWFFTAGWFLAIFDLYASEKYLHPLTPAKAASPASGQSAPALQAKTTGKTRP